MAEKKHPDKKHGKQTKQRMKPYIVLQYLLKNTDEEHFATGKDIKHTFRKSAEFTLKDEQFTLVIAKKIPHSV